MHSEIKYITDNWFGQFCLGPEEPGERHWIDDAEKELGGNERDVLYYFNKWRYRGEIEPGNGVPASFGCSHALGYGVQVPYAEMIGYANLGWSGLSNDGIARLVYTYCEEFKPKEIAVLWTVAQRREHVTEDGVAEKFRYANLPNKWESAYIELQNDKLDEYNLTKNKIFVTNYCELNNITCKQIDFTNNDKLARDGVHPGPDWHANIAGLISE